MIYSLECLKAFMWLTGTRPGTAEGIYYPALLQTLYCPVSVAEEG